MATIMAAMATIFKSHLSLSHSSGRKSSKYQFSLPNFELMLEIPNIMLVCKFEINWSTNKNLRALTTYLERTDAQHFHISRSALRGRGTISLYVVTGSIQKSLYPTPVFQDSHFLCQVNFGQGKVDFQTLVVHRQVDFNQGDFLKNEDFSFSENNLNIK